MNRKTLITLWIIWLIVTALLLSTKANASDTTKPDYMAQMIACAVSGDVDCGRQLATARNEKIDAGGLEYTKVDFDDLHLLAKIIYAEAGSNWLDDAWKMSVGEVVLNRVVSDKFPNTISEVIYQRGQYYGANSAYFASLQPDERCATIAKRLLEGERTLNDGDVIFQANFKQGKSVHTALHDKYLGWTYFCKG